MGSIQNGIRAISFSAEFRRPGPRAERPKPVSQCSKTNRLLGSMTSGHQSNNSVRLSVDLMQDPAHIQRSFVYARTRPLWSLAVDITHSARKRRADARAAAANSELLITLRLE